MFMLLKLQTSAIKFVFSFISNQSNPDVCNVTSMSDVVYTVNLVLVRTVKNNYFSLCTN